MAEEICKSCLAISGKERISQIPVLIETEHTIVEHIYPAKILGWLVITPKKHVVRISNLHCSELNDFLGLVYPCVKILKRILPEYEKEYLLCLAEKGGFNHIHMHVIPKHFNLPKQYWGKNIFDILSSIENNVEIEKLLEFHTSFRKELWSFNLTRKLSGV
ncbi:MAG: HIT domain-containing protein [Candidatus Paceibacterota bacterium]